MRISFANGLQLIYKPRDVACDFAYNTFLAWMNDHGARQCCVRCGCSISARRLDRVRRSR